MTHSKADAEAHADAVIDDCADYLSGEGRVGMSLEQIFEEFTPGSVGFIKAVQTHGGMDITNSEIARLASECPTWWTFEDAWENDTWWTDAGNLVETDKAENV